MFIVCYCTVCLLWSYAHVGKCVHHCGLQSSTVAVEDCREWKARCNKRTSIDGFLPSFASGVLAQVRDSSSVFFLFLLFSVFQCLALLIAASCLSSLVL